MHSRAGASREPERVLPNLWVYTPLVLRAHGDVRAIRLNRMALRATVGQIVRKLGMRDIHLWTWTPDAANYLDIISYRLLIYFCTDFAIDTASHERTVRTVTERADVVFATSHSLVSKLAAYNDNTFLASHGIDFDMFTSALDPDLSIPTDIADLPRPIVGYCGAIEKWLDLDLITYVAKRRPAWSFVLIGKEHIDASEIKKLPNVHLVGRRSHDDLPNYCKEFSAAIIPHRINSRAKHNNPVKLREYLWAGLPVVATAIPQVIRYGAVCRIADTYEEFDTALVDAIDSDTPRERRLRSEVMRGETWSRVVDGLCERILMIANDRMVAGSPSPPSHRNTPDHVSSFI